LEKKDELTQEDLATINRILKDNGDDPDQVVKVLQDIQKVLGYVPLAGQRLVAQKLKIPVSRIYGIVSFYNFFRTSPPGRHSVNLCMGTACYVRGAKSILDEIRVKYEVEPEGTTADGKFSLEVLRCLGCCAIGPVISVDGEVYGRMKPAKVKEVLEKYN
jgi:NADH:ubiquinone oxidoreductase subunit E